MADFLTLSVNDVITDMHRLPDKKCASIHYPTSLLREYVDMMTPFFVKHCFMSPQLVG